MSQPLYILKNLTQQFGERQILNISHLEIEAEPVYALLGHNGAGKSTLMKILAFLDTPYGGELYFKGRLIKKEQWAGLRAKVVWVPQSPVMFTGTLQYNIEYPMRLKRINKADYQKRAAELLEIVGLKHLAQAPAHRLSGGEAQRASTARALAAGAEVILFDEPTASVDYKSRQEIINLIKQLKSNHHLSILITTHDADFAQQLCDRHIYLHEGELAKDKNLNQIYRAALKTDNRLCLPQEMKPLLPAALESARINSLSSLPSGLTLKFKTPDNQEFEIIINDNESLKLASSLTLGQELKII